MNFANAGLSNALVSVSNQVIKPQPTDNEYFQKLGLQKNKKYILHFIGTKPLNLKGLSEEEKNSKKAFNHVLKGIQNISETFLPENVRVIHTAAAFYDEKEDKWKLIESALTGGDTAKEKDLSEALKNHRELISTVIAQETDQIDLNKLRSKIGSSYGDKDFVRLGILNRERISQGSLKEVLKAKEYSLLGFNNFGENLTKAPKDDFRPQFLIDGFLKPWNSFDTAASQAGGNPLLTAGMFAFNQTQSGKVDFAGDYCTELVMEALKDDSLLAKTVGKESFLTTPTNLLEAAVKNRAKFVQISGDENVLRTLQNIENKQQTYLDGFA